MANFNWPSSAASVSIAAIGTNGATAPTSSIEIAGIDGGGLLTPVVMTTNGLKVDGSAVTQPVSAASLPLPSGAATSANQTTGNTSLSTIATNTTGVATAANQSTGNTSLSTIATNTTGVATSAKQDTGNTSLASIVTNTTGVATAANQTTANASLSSIDTKTPALVSGRVPVDGSGVTQPIKILTGTAGAITQAAITVGTTAVRLTVSGSAPVSTRQQLMAIPDSASTAKFYIGTSSVTNSGATRGLQILAGMPFTVSNDAGDYYIISDTAAQTVYVLEQA